jgi:signal transduction histidine kinase
VRVRTFALALLVVLGLVPLAGFSFLAIQRSEQTAIGEVRASNRRLARSVADRIGAYASAQGELLHVIGAAALKAGSTAEAQGLLEAFAIEFRYLHDLAVFRSDGSRVAGVAVPDRYGALLARALAEQAGEAPIEAAQEKDGRFAHTQFVAEPVFAAGKHLGAITATIDLVHTWQPINAVQVGQRGFARLISFEGTLLAHGDPEERRFVYADNHGRESRIVAGALLGNVVANHQGVQVVTAAALVPGRPWSVLIEQPVHEAFAAARAMKSDLAWLGSIVIVTVLVAGVVLGRRLVASLERLRAHTGILARGKLDARIDESGPVIEIQVLGQALNEMAGSLKQLHEEAQARERLSTFARVAAGLAHDLRQPIETVRAACAGMMADPTDPGARKLFEFMSDRELPRLKRYVDDLRRIANEGEVQLAPSELDPRALADDIVHDLVSSPKWSQVTFQADGMASAFIADKNLIRRAVYNLAANAADACVSKGPENRVTIEVSDTEDGLWVEFRVSDTGGGIAPPMLEALLKGDFRSTKRSSGIGLGFGVARHVAQAHGGQIVAHSSVGDGSRFSLQLPKTCDKHPVLDEHVELDGAGQRRRRPQGRAQSAFQ